MPSKLPVIERLAEEVLGNRLGAGVYRRWAESLGLNGRERVLDVGTGAGACARHLADALAEGSLTCLDIDERWLAIAKERLTAFPRTVFVVADACEWTRPNAYDVATIHFVLHDVPAAKRLRLLRNVFASLREGGRLHVREPVTHGMTSEELEGLLLRAGFRRTGADVLGRIPLMGPALSASWERPVGDR